MQTYEEIKKERDDLKYEVMQLRTENNDITAAVTKTLKVLYEEYQYGTLRIEHYDALYNVLKDAEL